MHDNKKKDKTKTKNCPMNVNPLKRTNEPLPHPATTKAKAPTITVYQTTRTPPPPYTDDHQLSSKSPPPPTARRGVAKGAKLRLLGWAPLFHHFSKEAKAGQCTNPSLTRPITQPNQNPNTS